MRLTLVRNATLLLKCVSTRILVDPMLAPVGALPAVDPSTDERRNPLVELPDSATELVERLDAALVTHLHRDHFDADAAVRLPADTLVVTQPDSAQILRWMGFRRVVEQSSLEIGAARITRTSGRQTLDPELYEGLGPVCGFVVAAPGEPGVLIAGDSIWCDELAARNADPPSQCDRRQCGRRSYREVAADLDDRGGCDPYRASRPPRRRWSPCTSKRCRTVRCQEPS